ncbi:dehydrogenase/reductase SDR family member 4 isoform X3 [Pararge aegeria]|uniref:dehydrogenase/reductase SDR family member 4 isoform X3 n=1 Tax=Pararge aegeria TaxID=116150 RepID=UPI0019D2587B|nr:dehydrogenase/reductase SDR family member 4 isoform X3 [Pararge aegeria]
MVLLGKIMSVGTVPKIHAQITNAKSFHSSRLKGKVAIVTASTDGIGYAIAKRLGDEGASVIISSRKEDNVKKATENLRKDGINAEGLVCHVADAEHRKRLFEFAKSKYGGIDILVSNAAVNPAVSPVLEPLGPYSISKTTLLGLTKAIAYEVTHENIRVNCVAPGIVATKFASAITTSDMAAEKSLSIVPMKRFGKPSEIASAVAFLVSEDASYMTGETLVVAGGTYAHL